MVRLFLRKKQKKNHTTPISSVAWFFCLAVRARQSLRQPLRLTAPFAQVSLGGYPFPGNYPRLGFPSTTRHQLVAHLAEEDSQHGDDERLRPLGALVHKELGAQIVPRNPKASQPPAPRDSRLTPAERNTVSAATLVARLMAGSAPPPGSGDRCATPGQQQAGAGAGAGAVEAVVHPQPPREMGRLMSRVLPQLYGSRSCASPLERSR